ncbi:MAG: futalosine hydrolase [Chitinophagales bacterium]|nr:futalosine hydrolase [Chitinophagales bacterium]
MQICIVAATQAEIAPLSHFLGVWVAKMLSGIRSVTYRNLELDLLITGPGIHNTSYHLGRQFAVTKYDMVMNCGICGAFDNTLKIGEPVHIISEEFGDFGADDDNQFRTAFEIGLIEYNTAPFKNGKLMNAVFPDVEHIKAVKGLTVNTVHGNEKKIKRSKMKFDADVESMEGAAFFFACLTESLPFLSIRAVSNYIEKRNKNNWNIPLAIENANTALISILDKLAI